MDSEPVILIENFLTKDECKYIEDFLYRKEDEILSLNSISEEPDGPPTVTNSNYKNITTKVWTYNIFDYKEIYNILAPKYKKILTNDLFSKFNLHKHSTDEIWIRGWGNIWRKELFIGPHKHAGQGVEAYDKIRNTRFLVTHIFLSGPEHLGTHYLINGDQTFYNIDGKKAYVSDYYHSGKAGQLAITTSDIKHWVNKNETDIPRISLAADIRIDCSNYDVYNDPNGVTALYLWREI